VFPDFSRLAVSISHLRVLVASGVLIGLWISVRNSEKQGINGDDAWNLGILVVLAGIVGAKILYVVNDWSSYATTGARFSASTPAGGSVFSGGLIGALLMAACTCASSHAGPAHHRRLRARFGLRSRPRALRLLFSRMLLRQTDESLLGRHLPQSLANSVSGTPLGVRIEPTQLIEAAAEFFNFLC